MKLLLLVMVVAVAGQVPVIPPGDTIPEICAYCECLDTVPMDVDCTSADLREVPDLTADNFTFPWVLNLANNLISEVPKLPVVHNVLSLNFKRNRIYKIADDAFKELPELKNLYLQYNNLTDNSITEGVFRGHYNSTHPKPLGLEELDLSYNYITTLKINTLKHLSFLKRLLLSHNPIGDIPWSMAAAIVELHSLEELDLSQTGLDRLPSNFLTDLRNLRVLTLAGNKLLSVPSEVNYARNLVQLNLNANPITTVSVGDFQSGLKTLRVLEMSAMPHLRHVGSHAFSSLTSLQVLKMSDNPEFTYIDRDAFYKLLGDELALQEIHIQDNKLSSLEENMLPWRELKVVDIQNNPWNCDCHLKWVAQELIPVLETKNPETTLSIHCAEPIADRGMRVTDLLVHSHTFQCTTPHTFVGHRNVGPLIASTIVVGAILLLTGTLVFAYALFRRSRTRHMFGESIKYRRAFNEDQEAVGQTVHS